MGIKCAIICDKEVLLSQAMASLLDNDSSLEVYPIYTSNRNELLAILDDLRPEMAVLINVEEEVNPSILYELLRTYPGMHVTTVGIEENLICVYPDRKIIQKPAELLSIIHSV